MDGPADAANRILPRLTLVAMETKFEIKWAITRHMYEISPRLLLFSMCKSLNVAVNKCIN